MHLSVGQFTSFRALLYTQLQLMNYAVPHIGNCNYLGEPTSVRVSGSPRECCKHL